MKHRQKGKVLDRNKASREALYRSLASSLILHKKMKTTLAKAKAIRPIVEKFITISKENNLTSRRRLLAKLPEVAVKKLMSEIGPSYKERKGGYTRIMKLGTRLGDRAETAIIELI